MIYLDHLLEATRGVLRSTGRHTHFDTFNQDTRQLLPGELFVALRGEHSNGHDYALDALQRGATGLLLEAHHHNAFSQEMQTRIQQAQVATIVVEDTRLALQHYAR